VTEEGPLDLVTPLASVAVTSKVILPVDVDARIVPVHWSPDWVIDADWMLPPGGVHVTTTDETPAASVTVAVTWDSSVGQGDACTVDGLAVTLVIDGPAPTLVEVVLVVVVSALVPVAESELDAPFAADGTNVTRTSNGPAGAAPRSSTSDTFTEPPGWRVPDDGLTTSHEAPETACQPAAPLPESASTTSADVASAPKFTSVVLTRRVMIGAGTAVVFGLLVLVSTGTIVPGAVGAGPRATVVPGATAED
jgi:hypothetical protein